MGKKLPAKETKTTPFLLPPTGFVMALLGVSVAWTAGPGLRRLWLPRAPPDTGWVLLPACQRYVEVEVGLGRSAASWRPPCPTVGTGQPGQSPGHAVGTWPRCGTALRHASAGPSKAKPCAPESGPSFGGGKNNGLPCSKVCPAFFRRESIAAVPCTRGAGCWLPFLVFF